MCTVTFIPTPDKIILTSNRDEQQRRSQAIPPAVYDLPSGRLLFPKDIDAGGTWIAAHENGNAIVLLNGGWVAHTPQPPYRKSRGLILLDLLDSTMPYQYFSPIKLEGIEPFTAVIWEDGQLYECRWDGTQKYAQQLDASIPHIWSSVTLYGPDIIARRKQWFDNWLSRHRRPFQEDVLHFHQFTGDGDAHNDLLMNRDGKVGTVSVTSLAISPDAMVMRYLDLRQQQTFTQELTIEKIGVGR
ncbi:NRDE family protein [Paraflavitalea pollutisoli]|uniref:NRDE family protein n=1 Tax=Paraflavitalea pollutisoli TaxID=3034143 RepID=UPI0023EB8EAB|nr:NRDE family protein [Paraflavitalea sp. H1-2-19X]